MKKAIANSAEQLLILFRLFFIILLVISLTTGCTTQSPAVIKNSASSSTIKNESPDKQVQPTDFVNYDELAELARRMTNFTSTDYSDEQLNNMRKEDWWKNCSGLCKYKAID
ncbi:hypothetical protein ACFSTH_13990 [Paenibacillus yanchengensis]